MRKYTTTIFLLLFFISVYANEKPKVVATTTIIEDITKQLSGDKVEVISLVPVGGDPHLYDPVPQDAVKIANADLILKNGLTLEGWLNEFIENSGTKAQIFTVTEGVKPIESSAYANSPDPHAWMDASNGIIYAENIKKALIAIDGENTADYEAAFEVYKAKLEATGLQIKAMIDSIPADKRILITSHDAFQYYGRKYGLKLESILGTSTDAQAQTSDINRLYKVIKESKVPAIFIESTINPQTMKQIAKDTKIKIGGKLYADSLGAPDSEAGTYIGMLLWNTRNIANELLERVSETNTTKEEKSPNSWWLMLIIGILLLGGTFWMFRKMKGE